MYFSSPLIDCFRNGSISLRFCRVLQTEIRSSKFFSFLSNDLKLCGNKYLVAWRRHSYSHVGLASAIISSTFIAITRPRRNESLRTIFGLRCAIRILTTNNNRFFLLSRAAAFMHLSYYTCVSLQKRHSSSRCSILSLNEGNLTMLVHLLLVNLSFRMTHITWL